MSIEFYNRHTTRTVLFIEPFGHGVEMVPKTEYKIESNETEYRIELESNQLTVYLEYALGYKVFERSYSAEISSPHDWQLIVDYT